MVKKGQKTEQDLSILESDQQRCRMILDSVDDAVMVHQLLPDGLPGLFVEVNKAAYENLGYTRAEMLALGPMDIMEGLDEKMLSRMRAEFMERGKLVVESEIRHRDGAVFPVEVRSQLIQLDDLPMVVAVARDIRKRRVVEAEMRQTRDTARSASQAKSEFLTNISHELRTPLNGVLGMTGLLLQSDLDAQQRHYAEVVARSGETLLGLVNDLLEFARIEQGTLTIERFPFEVSILSDSLKKAFGPAAKERSLSFSVSLDEDVPARVIGDPKRIEQVLGRLVDNAIKFTHRGQVAVRFSWVQETDAQFGLRMEVSDTGIGVPADRQDEIFEQFTQVDASATRRYGGTGLGLAFARQLVELMNGQVGVRSSEGEGSTFWTFLPLAAETPRDGSQLGTGKVLVVEDDRVNQQVLAAMLEKMGLKADLAVDGRQAVDMAKQENYRLILMDLQMPGMNGLEAARAIREQESTQRRAVIVATTARVLQEDRRQCLAAGMDDFVAKPFTGLQLQTVLQRWVELEPWFRPIEHSE